MSTEDHQFSPQDIGFPILPLDEDIPANQDVPPQDIIDQLWQPQPTPTSPNGKTASLPPERMLLAQEDFVRVARADFPEAQSQPPDSHPSNIWSATGRAKAIHRGRTVFFRR